MEKKIIIRLNKSFYPKEVVLNSMDVFSELCDSIKNFEEGDYFIIELVPKSEMDEEEKEKMKYSFNNYCLGLIKCKM